MNGRMNRGMNGGMCQGVGGKMRGHINLRLNRYVALLLGATLVWGTTFPILKVVTNSLSGMEASALRFAIAALCMLPFALRAPKRAWIDGAALGALILFSYATQAYGLQFISSNRSAFLTSLNVLMVPALGFALGTPVAWRIVLAGCIACVGIGLMSWEGGSHLLADTATIAGAAGYALYAILLSQRAQRHAARDLASTQIIWMAVLGILCMLLTDWLPLGNLGNAGHSVDSGRSDSLLTLAARLEPQLLLGLAYLGVVATAGMLFIQAIAQRHVKAEQAALVFALEPVFAALFAWWLLAETMAWTAILGALLVLCAVVWSEWGNA
jgi:drug/metabolite transporter (DMT)-like permease